MTEYGIILDILILAGLGAFLFYATRLSSALNEFRKSRSEFNAMMQELNTYITKADEAIKNMKENAQSAGDNLYRQVARAKDLKDEMEVINQASDRLAERLEGLSDTNKVTPISRRKKEDGFPIHDADFEDDEMIEDESMETLPSAAEKELYKALKKAKT